MMGRLSLIDVQLVETSVQIPTGITRAIDVFLSLLIPVGEQHKALTIKIVPIVSQDLITLIGAQDDVAGGTFVQEGVLDSNLAETFTIVFDPTLDVGSIFTTIAHELVHVAQYYSGDLRVLWNGEYMEDRWKAERVPSGTDYWELPWEVEAYALQVELMDALIADEQFMNEIQLAA